MVTRVLIDIRNDLKLLISAITGFEDTEEGFDVCERFTLSNIKNHRYLSIDGNETKQKIDELITKFSIHGNYKVAKELQYLIGCFLHSFDFEQHPQYDLQWTLLSLLLDLANETTYSDLSSHVLPKNEYNVIATVDWNNSASNEIDWGPYLKEGQGDFFYDFQNSTESEWSDEEVTEVKEVDKCLTTSKNDVHLFEALSIRKFHITQYKLSKIVMEGLLSKNWLSNNVPNCWWYKLEEGGYEANSSSQHANFSTLWDKANLELLPNGTRTLSEYQVCRELMWMFYVQAQMTVFQQQEWEYNVIPNISIPSLSNIIMERKENFTLEV
ncbi:gamma-tubulin complex component 5 isoform X2 [Cephus cinctus]|uniref:Gamma-tubulin complex component 5 isoform X2 n=1 Tax=Cephus cinctus TaxID=211228 RepID=A0AAJ7W0F7_CEPCN|nr:gamma-tubulin complex component 5 isoform X2 [Cephus cinctus]